MPVSYELRGSVPNEEIQRFYYSNRVDCFITTSETEGLPVSIMEAMAYGIPIVATDVGGIREMIDGNGVLLSSDPSAEETGKALIEILLADEKVKTTYSERSAQIWESRFNRKKNVGKFIEQIINNDSEGMLLYLTVNSVKIHWSFFAEELVELAKHFKIRIIETQTDDTPQNAEKMLDDLSKNIKHFVYRERVGALTVIRLFFRYLFDQGTREERREIVDGKKNILRRMWESCKYFRSAELFFDWFQTKFSEEVADHRFVFYSYWLQPYTLGMCLHKRGFKLYTRAHGYDLYNERYTKGFRQPFRRTMDPLLDGVFFVSNAGKAYYEEHFSTGQSERYQTCYLGSTRIGEAPNVCTREETDDVLTLVSCSSLIPLKRVRLIIDALRYISEARPDVNIKWIHFGDGPQRAELERYAEDRLAFSA